MKKNIIILILVGVSFLANAQNDTIALKLKSVVDKIQAGSKTYPILYEMNLREQPSVLLPYLKKYEQLKNADVQFEIYNIYNEIALKTSDLKVKKELVNHMLRSCTDSLGLNYACNETMILLTKFDIMAFDDKAKKTVLENLKFKYTSDSFILLVGFLDLKAAIPRLEELLSGKNNYDKWYIHLALARLGNLKNIAYCINEIKSKSNYPYTASLDDALYIKHPSTIQIFEKYLNSNDNFPPEERKKKGQPISSIGIVYLGTLLDNFPVKCSFPYDCDYDDNAEKNCREWMKKNKGKYKIRKNIF